MTRFRLKPALLALAALLCASVLAHAASTTTFFGNVAIPNVVVVDGATGAPVTSSNPLTVSAARAGYKCTVTITRPNDTTAYGANDVVGGAQTLSSCGPAAGGESVLISAEFEIDASAAISGETTYALYLYSVTPPSAAADNAAFDIPSGDRASFVGKVSLGTPVDEGATLYVATDAINKAVSLASGSLYAYLVTAGAYTPTAQRVYKVTLHFLAV